MKEVFSFSDGGCKEYSASIVKIGELIPIEGSDFLARTVVDGEDIVVRKDEVSPGDVMVYARIETTLDPGFLKANNLYEYSERDRNANYSEVQSLINSGQEEEAKKRVGFFNKHGRVKIIKLRGCPSKGFLFKKDALVNWKPELKDINLEDYIDIPYIDSICGEVFIKVYVPLTNIRKQGNGKKGRKIKDPGYDILIPGQFELHYSTTNINKEISQFSPDDKISVSVKLHGTSICIGNVLIKKPISRSNVSKMIQKAWWGKLNHYRDLQKTSKKYSDRKFYGRQIENVKKQIKPTYNIGYGVIYSSRNVIKNQYINKKVGPGFYNVDVWGEYYKLLKDVIPQGYELFGEIVGYVTGGSTMIQKNYDYGCKPGENKLMIYRIQVNVDGKKKDLDVPEVLKFSKNLVKEHPELKNKIHHIDLLYNGTLRDLYPHLNTEQHWHDEVLGCMKNDKEHFGMELDEPLCIKKVPREGIVIRKDGDPVSEAFKLKTNAYLFLESKSVDKGEIDMEMKEGYDERTF